MVRVYTYVIYQPPKRDRSSDAEESEEEDEIIVRRDVGEDEEPSSKEIEEIFNPKPPSDEEEGEDLFDDNMEKYSIVLTTCYLLFPGITHQILNLIDMMRMCLMMKNMIH